MCLAVPMQIKEMLQNNMALAVMGGVHKEVSLMLIDDAKIGDFVLVHAGYAIAKLDEVEALKSLEMFKEPAQ